MTVNIESREFPNILPKMIASPENMDTALSPHGEDASTLGDILDQVCRRRDKPMRPDAEDPSTYHVRPPRTRTGT